MKKRLIVEGMHCTACSLSIEKVTRRLDGVKTSNVNLIAKTLSVEYDENLVDEKKIIEAVKNAGFTARVDDEKSKKDSATLSDVPTYKQTKWISTKARLVSSVFIMIPLMVVAMSDMLKIPLPNFVSMDGKPLNFAIIQLLLSLSIIIINGVFYINGFKGLVHGYPNMDTLVSLGSFAAFLYGIIEVVLIGLNVKNGNRSGAIEGCKNLYFDSAAMILTLITVGKTLEEKAKGKTASALESLKKLTPNTATIIVENEPKVIDFNLVKQGDLLAVKAGESIPVDGVVVDGGANVNESALTGEPIPKAKTINDNVISGSINVDGYIVVRAVSVGEDTTLSKIINLVKDAGATKAPIQRIADKISFVFVPTIICLSVLVFAVWAIASKSFENAIFHAIQVLVISCPCALGLATPVAVTASIGACAKNGTLIKNAAVFEGMCSAKAVVFDKTGTITKGEPEVEEVLSFNGYSNKDLIVYAKTVEAKSNHPLSKAIMKFENNIKPLESTNHQTIIGGGVSCVVDKKTLIGGNKKHLEGEGVIISDEVEKLIKKYTKKGATALLFAIDKILVGIITVRDKLKDSSADAVKSLKEMGYTVAMISGDGFDACNYIKNEAGLDMAYDSVLPQDKERIVSEVEEAGMPVVFVGDGINDSPALTKASIGIAVANGTDIAIDSASVVLMNDDMSQIPRLYKTSKRTVKIIKENLFWAFIYNIICIPIAAGAFSWAGINLNPMLASLSMSLSSLFVVTNALRLKKEKK